MTYVVSQFWVWLLSALVVGALTAAFGSPPTRHGKIAGWLRWWGLAFAAGLPVAFLHVLSGRPAVYLETGLATFAAFLAGAGLATVSIRQSLSRHEAWALGLVPAALIWWGGNLSAGPNLEADLGRKVAALVERAGGDPLDFEVAGRDVLLPVDVFDRAALADDIRNIPGVRLVAGSNELMDLARKSSGEAVAATEPAKAASPGEEPAKPASGPSVAEAAPAGSAPPPAEPAEKAPTRRASPEERAKAGAAVLAALPRTGELDAAACQSALSATLSVEKIQFGRKSAAIHDASAGVLDKLAALLQRCPDVKVEIAGHTDSVGHDEDNDELSTRRAQRVVDYLVRTGVARGRLAAVGYGARKPIASNDTEEGRAENRRIEFVVQPRR